MTKKELIRKLDVAEREITELVLRPYSVESLMIRHRVNIITDIETAIWIGNDIYTDEEHNNN